MLPDVQPQSSVIVNSPPRTSFPIFTVPWAFRHGPRLRQVLRTQEVLLSLVALIYLTLWALDIPTPFLMVLVNTVVIGNVLTAVMEYMCSLYDRLNSPWNWLVYVTLLVAISVLGIALAAGSLYYLMPGAGLTYRGLLRSTGPFSLVVSMGVGIVWYSAERIHARMRDRNLQLESALEAKSDVVRMQEQELVRARQIQQDLLPKVLPQMRGIQVAGAWQPATAVSGDYYDVLALDEYRLALCIGDVIGKGITAALLMANLQAAFRAFATTDASPASVCGKLNAFMCSNVASGRFISLFYCIVDVRDRSLAYENAGHCPAQLAHRSGETVALMGEGAVLGVLPDWGYRNNRVQLESGDHLVLFTDGVTEAEDAYGREFGEERVVQVLQNVAGYSAEEVRRALMDAVNRYCSGNFRDDATLVVLAVQ